MPLESQAGIKEEKLAPCNFSGHRACGLADKETLLSRATSHPSCSGGSSKTRQADSSD